MKFECKDMERALEVPELLPDAREHARDCAVCRRELWIWGEMSQVAGGLREEWDSPELWSRVRQALRAEPKPKQTRHIEYIRDWRLLVAIAAVLVISATAALWYPFRQHPGPAQSDEAFLTEQTLKELEQAESAYSNSIGKLARLAESHLQRADAGLASAYKEKLAMLDSAIAELKTTVDQNRFNARLQAELAALYKQKQQTLQEIVREQKN